MNCATQTIKNQGFLNLSIPSIPLCSQAIGENGAHQLRQRTNGRFLKFPGKSFRDSHVCVVMLRVIRLILENLELGTNITTRDIYYQDVELFGSQTRVSAAVERLCLNTGVPRSLFQIMPSPKGLIVADLEVTLKEAAQGHDTKTILSRSNGIALIPVGQEIVSLAIPEGVVRPKYVLIVEKEGVFSHLYSSLPEAIIITGKGFPDHYTRKFVYAIHKNFPELPIYGLVDSDVHGIQILRTYQNSGQNTLEFHYPVENIQFLGVSIYDYTQGWVDITTHEYKLIMSMLQKDWILDEQHTQWRREIQRQMFMGKKVEMNILDRSHLTTLVNYVKGKVQTLSEVPVSRQRPVLSRAVKKPRAQRTRKRNLVCPKVRPTDTMGHSQTAIPASQEFPPSDPPIVPEEMEGSYTPELGFDADDESSDEWTLPKHLQRGVPVHGSPLRRSKRLRQGYTPIERSESVSATTILASPVPTFKRPNTQSGGESSSLSTQNEQDSSLVSQDATLVDEDTTLVDEETESTPTRRTKRACFRSFSYGPRIHSTY